MAGNLTESEQKFFDHCWKTIESAIDHQESKTYIRFKDYPALSSLSYGSVNLVYKILESDEFNHKDIGLSFGGYDHGSSVHIEYLNENKNIQSDACYQSNMEKLFECCQNQIAKIDLDEPNLDRAESSKLFGTVTLEPMLGYLWYRMYYDIKQRLKPLGYTLFSIAPLGWELRTLN